MEMTKRKESSYMQETKKIKYDLIVEFGGINYITVPSLESMAMMSIITRLWKRSDFKDALQVSGSRRGNNERDKILHQMEETVSEKLSLLPLPISLKAKITNISWPVGLQILKLLSSNTNYYYTHNVVEHLNSIHWTMRGTIDKVETLKFQINNRNLTANYVNDVFILACKYCLEDSIHKLWPHIVQKFDFSNGSMHSDYSHHLLFYWISFVKKELPDLINILKPFDRFNLYNRNHSINVNMFSLSFYLENAIAMKYFWSKFTEEERRLNTVKWVEKILYYYKGDMDYLNHNERTDILCFLLSHLHKDQQRDVFKKYSYPLVIVLFNDWPWQKFLMPTIQVMWDYLQDKAYIELLSNVLRAIQRGRSTEKILNALWCNSPKHLKKRFIQYILNGHDGSSVLCQLFEIDDIESLKLLLNDATVEEKRRIIFDIFKCWKENNLFTLFYRGKFHLLDMLVVDILSESEIANCKENFALSFGHTLCHKWIIDDNWQTVDKYLNWSQLSEIEVNHLKRDLIKNSGIVDHFICVGDYEAMNKFLLWCFNSEEKINQFKREQGLRMENETDLLTSIARQDFDTFLKFVNWCYNSETHFIGLKMQMSNFDKLSSVLFHLIGKEHKFEFTKELVRWVFSSEEEIHLFKKKLILSGNGKRMFETFFNYNIFPYYTRHANWELVEELAKWYYPLEKNLISHFKREIRHSTDTVFGEKCFPCFSTQEIRRLILLLTKFALDKKDDDQGDDIFSDGDYSSTDSDSDDVTM